MRMQCYTVIRVSHYHTIIPLVGQLLVRSMYYSTLDSNHLVKFRNTSPISLDGKSSRSIYFWFHDVSNTSIMLFRLLILHAYESFIRSYVLWNSHILIFVQDLLIMQSAIKLTIYKINHAVTWRSICTMPNWKRKI